ncbi:MAG: GntP family permease, partial [Cyclobacteriaceae bacterium]
YPTAPFGEGKIVDIIIYLGNPVTALLIGIVFALFLPKKLEKFMVSSDGWIGKALGSAAVIILITGAGGAFGTILKTSDIGEVLAKTARDYPIGLWLPFLVAACVKTAQGSSTVALTTAASIMAPLMVGLGMDTEIEKAVVVVAIGAGSAVISHTNDSFFWVVTQMSDMSVSQGYRLQSLGTAVLGFTAMILLSILNLFI